MGFLPLKHFFWVLCFAVSCSGNADSSPVLASVGDITYTENMAKAEGYLNQVGPSFIDRWVDREILYQSAINNDYDKDNTTKQKSINHLKQIIGRYYLESLIQNQINITETEVIDYYNKTREQYKRKEREAVVLIFSLTDRVLAKKLASNLKKHITSNADNKLGELLATYNPRRKLVFENRLKESIRKRVFSNRLHAGIVGPIRNGNKFYVINVVKVFEKGTIKNLIHVQDQIQRKLLEIKKLTLKKTILDSLRAVYSVDIINQGSL
ncbi:peptidyl-prolyl cis-trans isomerase [Caldithrix abyssi]|nr:peptidyl-prolyl cis-trans isomerase [Caldithrix abyssi]